MKTELWFFLKHTKDRDVPGVSNFLGEIGCIVNKFWLEIRVFFCLCQKSEINPNIKILEPLINKARGGLLAKVMVPLLGVRAGLVFARAYFLPVHNHELPRNVRLVPSW